MNTRSFFFNDTATTEIYTLPYTTLFRSLCTTSRSLTEPPAGFSLTCTPLLSTPMGFLLLQLLEFELTLEKLWRENHRQDRKSTRLNSSHANISYAVFCLKKKKINLSVSF